MESCTGAGENSVVGFVAGRVPWGVRKSGEYVFVMSFCCDWDTRVGIAGEIIRVDRIVGVIDVAVQSLIVGVGGRNLLLSR